MVCVLGNDFNLRLHLLLPLLLLLLSFYLSMCIFGMCFWIVAVGLCFGRGFVLFDGYFRNFNFATVTH